MRARFLSMLLVVLVAACGGSNKRVREPELGGSPAAFQRAIGLSLLRTGQPRRALPYLQRLARIVPDRAEPRCYVGRAFLDLEMWEQAQALIDEALAIDPRHAPAHSLRGVMLDARNQHAAALDAHRRAATLDPENAAYHNNVGFSLYLHGRYADALAAYHTALRYGPSLQRVHNNIGFTLGKLDRIDDAREHFRNGGTPAEAMNNLGMVLEERGQLERAYDAYTEALQRAPELLAARGNLERISEQLGKPLPAIPERRD